MFLGGDMPDVSGTTIQGPPEMDQYTLDPVINRLTVPGELLKAAVFTADISDRVDKLLLDDDLKSLIARRVDGVLGLELVPDKRK